MIRNVTLFYAYCDICKEIFKIGECDELAVFNYYDETLDECLDIHAVADIELLKATLKEYNWIRHGEKLLCPNCSPEDLKKAVEKANKKRAEC